jgi:outer membrane protein OmpA-like peptidoglycan-associated protein
VNYCLYNKLTYLSFFYRILDTFFIILRLIQNILVHLKAVITTLFLFIGLISFSQNDNLAITRYEKIPSTTIVNQLKVDSQNRVYVATTKGLFVINGEETQSSLEDKNIIDIAVHSKMGCWAIDEKKLYGLSGNKVVGFNDEKTILTSLDFYKNDLYVGSNKGVYIVHMPSQRIELKTVRNTDLEDNHINFVFTDSKGRGWLGTRHGEVRINDSDWQVDHIDKNITHYYENKEGLWFISTNGKRKQEMWLIDHFNRSYDAGFGADLYKGVFNDFAIDSKGMLYFASDAFIRFDPYEDKTINFTENAGVISQKCTATVCDTSDVIWVGTDGDGLFKLTFKEAKDQSLNIACITEKKPSCYGLNDATIRVIVSGGMQPFVYEWSDNSLVGNNPKNLHAGNYTVTVSDKIGNKQICSIEIQSPDKIDIETVFLNSIKSYNGKEGKIKVKGLGGAGNYLYQWGNGSKNDYLDNLASGTYSVTVSDKNKCTTSREFQLLREKILPDLVIQKLEVGKTLRIDELFFKADSTEVSPESYDVLNEVLTFLQQNPKIVVEIGGHTNTIPSHEYCDKLSTERAKSIATYFYKKGILPERLSFKGYGKRQPISDSVSLEGRRKNQRVEIKIISI